LVADYEKNEGPEPDANSTNAELDEDDGEMFFPKEYNDQQKEIWERLRARFGVLVQGPPGTGKTTPLRTSSVPVLRAEEESWSPVKLKMH
jgi:hypothetical protein